MVNTFIPYSNFKKIAKVLDNKRLGKQRVEAKQILDIVTDKAKYKAWHHHPIVYLWMGHADALRAYLNEMIKEWIKRGFKNTMEIEEVKDYKTPWFLNCKTINLSHQASLLRKYPEYYSKFFKVPRSYMKYSYVWSKHLNEEQIKQLIKNKNEALPIHLYAKKLALR